jgi:hypothetical protein
VNWLCTPSVWWVVSMNILCWKFLGFNIWDLLMEVAGILCCYVGLVFYFNSRIACCDLSINLHLNVPLEMDLRWIVEKFYCSVRSAWTVNFHGNSIPIGNRYEEIVLSRAIYHMSRLCIWNFIKKYWVLIIICYFTRKLCKSINLTDSVLSVWNCLINPIFGI